MKEQEYKKLYSENEEELKNILEAIISRNSQFSKMEIVEMLRATVKEALKLFMNDLKLINFKGYNEFLPGSAKIGDVYCVDNKFYICESIDKENGAQWRRLCTEADLSAYYTKLEFDEKYVQHIGLISELVSGNLYEYSEDFKNRFITKADAQEWRDESFRRISDYVESINELLEWRASEQRRVDEYTQTIDELSAFVEEMKLSQAEILSSWISEQSCLISSKLQELDLMYADLEQRLNDSEQKLQLVSTEVAILSGAFDQIRKGKQEVLGERYEA